MSQRAVFLDRDDTLVVDSGFIDHPDKVSLVPGAAEAVQRLKAAGYKVVVATNQSGIARGYFDETQLRAIHERLLYLLSEQGASLDGIYYCPYLEGPAATVEAYRQKSDLRKPEPGMLLLAAREMDLDLSSSWMVGDEARDIEAGAAAGCRTIHIDRNGRGAVGARVEPEHRVGSLLEAVAMVEKAEAEQGGSQAGSIDSGVGREGDRTVPLLTEIRDLLDREQRAAMHDDFSLRRLMATLVQLVALVSAGWGLDAMFSADAGAALARFGLAGFLQLLMISLTLSDRRR